MLQSIVSRFVGGRRGAAPVGGTTRPAAGTAGSTARDAAIGRGVRGLLGRFARR